MERSSLLTQRTALPAGKAPRVISIEGLIGGGKTSLIAGLMAELAARRPDLRVRYVPEPAEEWVQVGALQRFYASAENKNRADAVYVFQTYTYVTRVKAMLQALREAPGADILLTERTVLTDRHVFMGVQKELVGAELMAMYAAWCDLFAELLAPLDFSGALYVYLRPSVEACMSRVRQRARTGEIEAVRDGAASAREAPAETRARAPLGAGGVSEEYQRCLLRAHDAFLLGSGAPLPEVPFDRKKQVVLVDGELADADFRGPCEALSAIADKIIDKIFAIWPELGCGPV
jgi:deoxyadenosine/deoxycytidine kinase